MLVSHEKTFGFLSIKLEKLILCDEETRFSDNLNSLNFNQGQQKMGIEKIEE